MTRLGLVLAGLLVLLGATACTGVPTSSAPEIIQSVSNVEQQPVAPTITPSPGADPRTIVQGFLSANPTPDANHTAARGFLTPSARNRWTDATVTVVSSYTVGNFSADGDTVTVSGQELGTVAADGVYTPILQGNGSGGPPVPFTFVLKQVAGQWRIDSLPSGLLVSEADFQQTYGPQRSLYFYDLTGTELIPDPRFTALDDPSMLANWLIQQLVTGPRPELQSVAASDVPAQTDPRRVSVTVGSSITRVEIPGASQLDGATRNLLAAQVAVTLEQVNTAQSIEITDGGKPVTIPLAKGVGFTAALFQPTADSTSVPPVFYLSDSSSSHGAVLDERGTPITGPAGTGQYDLTSVALAHHGESDLSIAGTTGPADDARLLVGTESQGLQVTALHGRLTRPTWAPETSLDEVWIGDGPVLYRVDGSTPSVVAVTPTTGVVTGDITAVRLSPDGSRVALVISGQGDAGQLWVGSVLRATAGTVRVDNLEQISPQGIDLSDVAWYGSLKLFTIGRPTSGGPGSVYEVGVDGSGWTPRSTSGLPQAPDSITVADGALAWVSAGPTVWEQPSDEWTSPVGTNTPGTAPVYLE